MELLCPTSNISTSADINSDNVTYYLSHGNVTNNITKLTEIYTGWDYTDFTKKVAVPVLCLFGIIGNILNIVILSTRIREGKKNLFQPLQQTCSTSRRLPGQRVNYHE